MAIEFVQGFGRGSHFGTRGSKRSAPANQLNACLDYLRRASGRLSGIFSDSVALP
jgi:hypothetical protein